MGKVVTVVVAKAPTAKKTTPAVSKKAKVKVIQTHAEPVDSRGRLIGMRGKRRPVTGGSIMLTPEERTVLRSLASRPVTEGKVGALERAMSLEVGETDVALGTSLQSFAMGLAQARRHETLEGREFNYTVALFSPGVGLPAVNVLWIQRTV